MEAYYQQRELIVQAAPELVEVVTKKKSPKQAIKSTVQKTVQKQVGGSLVKKKYIKKKQTKSRSKTIHRKQPLSISRSQFFSKVQNVYYFTARRGNTHHT